MFCGDEREHRCQHVDERSEQHEREGREREPELERSRGRHAFLRDGPVPGASHQPVEVAIEHVVERARSAAGERQPGHRDPEGRERRHAAGADEHPGRAGQQEQRHDPRLGQRDVVAPGRRGDGLAAEGPGCSNERRGEREARQRQVRRPRGHERGRQERDERGQRRPEQPPVRDPGCGDECNQGRQR
jgi:hypothetical protein